MTREILIVTAHVLAIEIRELPGGGNVTDVRFNGGHELTCIGRQGEALAAAIANGQKVFAVKATLWNVPEVVTLTP